MHPVLRHLASDAAGAATPAIMGILNVTPDSFSDGGQFVRVDDALARARQMVDEGADIIDVGGESTRPGAGPVAVALELERVLPVLEALGSELDVALSIDTSHPDVMRAAVNAGAGLVNDVRALAAPGAVRTAADLGVPVCLVHMQGEPRSMNRAPRYRQVVAEVRDFLLERADRSCAGGVERERIIIDPGIGFGKSQAHSLRLLAELEALVDTGFPVLVGASRKFTAGAFAKRSTRRRLGSSVALALQAACRGASILRVHDVAETVDALRAQHVLEEIVTGNA